MLIKSDLLNMQNREIKVPQSMRISKSQNKRIAKISWCNKVDWHVRKFHGGLFLQVFELN